VQRLVLPDVDHTVRADVTKPQALVPILHTQQDVAIPINRHAIRWVVALSLLINLRLIANIDCPGPVGQLQAIILVCTMPPVSQGIMGRVEAIEHALKMSDLLRAIIHGDKKVGYTSSPESVNLVSGKPVTVRDKLDTKALEGLDHVFDLGMKEWLTKSAEYDGS
jgi:hypothetical protein